MGTHNRVEFELHERQKEIACLNQTIALLGTPGREPDDIYAALVLCIPAAFQFPERTRAELILGDKRYRTPEYSETDVCHREPIALNGRNIGTLTVCYVREETATFLPEERTLLRNLAHIIAFYHIKQLSEHTLQDTLEQMEQRSAKFEALLDALPDLLFVLDKAGTITDYRAGKGDDLAMSPDLFLHRNLAEIFPPTLSDHLLGMIGRTVAGEKNLSTEYSLEVAGNTQYYEARMSKYGKDRVIALVNNITDRVLARERLIQSEERYRSLIDSSDAMIIMVDGKGNFLYINAIAAGFFWHSAERDPREEILGSIPQ